MIYFIGNKDKNLMKIGFTKNILKRLNVLQNECGFKLDIYRVFDGDAHTEGLI